MLILRGVGGGEEYCFCYHLIAISAVITKTFKTLRGSFEM